MHARLLSILADDRPHAHAALAEALCLDAKSLAPLMWDLAEEGLVFSRQSVGMSCGRSCRGCALAKRCPSSDIGQGASWTLTDSGRIRAEELGL